MTHPTTEQLAAQKAAARDKRRYVKVRPHKGEPWATFEPREAEAFLANASIDDECDFETAEVWMTKAEFEALPEFGGW
jgi:hypothetical protein